MVLISLMIFSKLFYPKRLDELRSSLKTDGDNKGLYRQKVILSVLWFSVILLFLMFSVVPAILIASNCTKNNIGHLILAFLFSDIYVFHYSIRKFVFKDGYCNI